LVWVRGVDMKRSLHATLLLCLLAASSCSRDALGSGVEIEGSGIAKLQKLPRNCFQVEMLVPSNVSHEFFCASPEQSLATFLRPYGAVVLVVANGITGANEQVIAIVSDRPNAKVVYLLEDGSSVSAKTDGEGFLAVRIKSRSAIKTFELTSSNGKPLICSPDLLPSNCR
jgi:hypothetical protein